MAIGKAAKAQVRGEIASKANLSRQNPYKPLTGDNSPKFGTIKKVVEDLGCELVVT